MTLDRSWQTAISDVEEAGEETGTDTDRNEKIIIRQPKAASGSTRHTMVAIL